MAWGNGNGNHTVVQGPLSDKGRLISHYQTYLDVHPNLRGGTLTHDALKNIGGLLGKLDKEVSSAPVSVDDRAELGRAFARAHPELKAVVDVNQQWGIIVSDIQRELIGRHILKGEIPEPWNQLGGAIYGLPSSPEYI